MRIFEGRHEYQKDVTKFTSHDEKRKIIPEEWKEDIDRLLTQDLLTANRYFAEENPNIAKHIADVVKMDPETFFRELTHRWNWHNEYFEKYLEPVVARMLEDRHIALSPQQVEWIKKAYKISSQVDQATLITTGAIKKHLDIWTKIEYTGDMTEEERAMLITPPVDSFMAEYEREHVEYLIARKRGDRNAEKLRNQLMSRYHVGDERIFKGRMQAFEKYNHTSPEELEERISKLSLKREYEIDHFYLTLERPRLRAIRDIVAFDNRDEYYLLKALVGVSGFILRKRVLEYLNETKILINTGNIYEFSDEAIIKSLDKLKIYRESLMRKKVEGFAQSADTCASAAYMMVMHALFHKPLNQEEELRLHKKAQSKVIPGAFFSALALEGAREGAEIALLHSEKEMFKRGNLESNTFEKLLKEYRRYAIEAQENGASIKNEVVFSEQMIKDLLARDRLLVVAGMSGGFLHAVVAVGYSPEGIIVQDPLNPEPKVWNAGRMERYMKTPVGQWMLVVGRKEGKIREYLDKAEEFERQAEGYLSTIHT